MNQPKPHSINFKTLVSDIEQARIKVPQFQREFVWNNDDDKFIHKRSKAIHDEIKKKIIIRDIDIID